MIELLKSGNINTRLLCEMAAHRDFVKLLADIEIYVGGIASMQVQNLNALVDMARVEITEKYQPGEGDTHIRLLRAAHIEEDTYFQNMVYSDMDSVIKEIKESHKSDTTSAPDTAAAEEIRQAITEAASFTGSPQEKQVVVMCRQLGIDYKKPTAEEFQVIDTGVGKIQALKYS